MKEKKLTKLFCPNSKARFSIDPWMRIAGFMSGSGSNLVKIIEHAQKLEAREGKPVYKVELIFSDRANSNATQIGKEYNIPVFTRDITGFRKSKKVRKIKELSIQQRKEFELPITHIMRKYEIDCIVLAGYMLYATPLITGQFLTVNIHPADLSILDEKGKRKYKGLNVVQKAIDNREKYLASTIHIAEPEIDGGQILLIGPQIKIEKEKDAKWHQEMLKEKSDWKAYPLAIELIAKEKYSRDEHRNLYFNNNKTEVLRLWTLDSLLDQTQI